MNQNLVLVTVDSFRADHCGFLGSDYELTPTLDAMATEGLAFERAFAPGPRTPSSMPVIFTGEFVQRRNLGVYQNYEEKSSAHVGRRERIRRHLNRFRPLPERLRDMGYNTGGVTANPWTAPDTRFDRGFDDFRAIQDNETQSKSLSLGWIFDLLPNAGPADWLLTWPDFYDQIIACRENLDEPYFLWVFLLDPHQPYFTPAAFREESSALSMYYSNLRHIRYHSYTDSLQTHLESQLKQSYRDTIRSVDSFLDRLLSDLADDDPAVVVHADHGEAFHEHGTYGHRPQLYRENLHVPLVVHGANATGQVTAPVTLRDLPELVTRVAADGTFDPTTLSRPFLRSRTEEAERTAIRNEEWLYISADETYADYLHDFRPAELYRPTVDLNETRNLIEKAPEPATLLRRVLEGTETHDRECAAVADAVETVVGTD